MTFQEAMDVFGIETAGNLAGFAWATKTCHMLGYLELLAFELYSLDSPIPESHSPLWQKWERRACELDQLHNFDDQDFESILGHAKFILENWNK